MDWIKVSERKPPFWDFVKVKRDDGQEGVIMVTLESYAFLERNGIVEWQPFICSQTGKNCGMPCNHECPLHKLKSNAGQL